MTIFEGLGYMQRLSPISSALWFVQALGIALKLTYEGTDQLWHQETAYCVVVRTLSPNEKEGLWIGIRSRNIIR